MTLISRLTAAFAVVLALLVVFAAAPAEGQWVRLAHTNTTTFIVPPDEGDYLELNIEVGGFRPAIHPFRSLSVLVTGEYKTSFRPGVIGTSDCSFIEWLVNDDGDEVASLDFAETRATVKLRIYSGASFRRDTDDGVLRTALCEVSATVSYYVNTGGGEEDSITVSTPIYLLPYKPTLNFWFETDTLIADPNIEQSLPLRTAGFFGLPYVELDQDRSHHLCGFADRNEHAVGPGIPDEDTNLWWEWDGLRPSRITSDQIAPDFSVECVIVASDSDFRTAYNTVKFVAIDDDGDPPEPPPVVDTPARRAMLAFYNATSGPNWHNNTSWGTDRPLSDWYGVTTDNDGSVTGLNLPDNNLSGEIPRELGDLPNLVTLVLTGNNLEGSIPESLRRFENTINPQQGGRNLPVGTTPPPPPDDLEITLWTNDSWHITEGPYYDGSTRNYHSTTDLVLTASRPVSTRTDIDLVVVGGSASQDDYDIISAPETVILPGETTASARVFHAKEDQIEERSETVVIEGRFGDGRTTNRQTITIWDRGVPALPFLGALLLAAGLCVMGLRKVREGRG